MSNAQHEIVQGKPQQGDRILFFDGLRGWMALIVLLFHSTQFFAHFGFLMSGPFSFFFNGGMAVSVFFVLSGAALSVGLVKRHSARDIAFSALKRVPRLTIPIFASCVVAYVLMLLGAMHSLQGIEVQYPDPSQLPQDGYHKWLQVYYSFDPSFLKMLAYSFCNVFWTVDTFADYTSYNGALWTMPFEFMGSFLIFGFWTIYGAVKRQKFLFGLVLALSFIVFWIAPANAFFVRMALLFVFGAFCAEQYVSKGAVLAFCSKPLMQFVILAFAVLLYSLGQIDLLACVIVLLTVSSKPLAWFLSTKVSVFLGKISFPLYVIHTPIVCSFLAFLAVKYYAPGDFSVSAAIVCATVLLSLLSAVILLPVEKMAISVSKKIADWIVG
jgi:peptidoglycan/LPS O-acetylase OafA/YrhL